MGQGTEEVSPQRDMPTLGPGTEISPVGDPRLAGILSTPVSASFLRDVKNGHAQLPKDVMEILQANGKTAESLIVDIVALNNHVNPDGNRAPIASEEGLEHRTIRYTDVSFAMGSILPDSAYRTTP